MKQKIKYLRKNINYIEKIFKEKYQLYLKILHASSKNYQYQE